VFVPCHTPSFIILPFDRNAQSIHCHSQNLCTTFLKEQAGIDLIALLVSCRL